MRTVQASIAEQAPGLTAAYLQLAELRETQLDRLDEYIERGLFPENSFHADRTPYFVDDAGNHCAVAYLMAEAGESKAVASIRQADNQVRVADVTEGPLLDWVHRSGLTQEEAAEIQPSYGSIRGSTQYKTAQELERERIQQHLRRVYAGLIQETPRSLAAILRQRLPAVRNQLGVESIGFVIDPPSPHTRSLVNRSSAPLHVRFTRRDDLGYYSSEAWQVIAGGEVLEMSTATEQLLFVEWRSDQRVADLSLDLQHGGSAAFDTTSLELDRLYGSMRGPEHVMRVQLKPNAPRELLWIRGIRVEAIEGDLRSLCHTNVDRVNVPEDSSANSSRLFTLSQGQTAISLPEGTAIAVWSDEWLQIVSQAYNPDPRRTGTSVRFRTIVEFAPDAVQANALVPLYTAVATSLKPLRNAGGVTGHHHAQGSSEPLVTGSDDELSSWHWEIPPGEDITTTRVSSQLNIAQDTTLHFAGAHLHRFARYLALWDRTTGTQVFRSDVRYNGALEVDSVGTLSSSHGVELRAGHDYELVSVYDNRSAKPADAMATVFLYLREP